MKFRTAIPKVFAAFMAFTLAFTSCTPNSNPNTYTPGKGTLPQADPESGYALLELDSGMLPEQTTLLEEKTSTVSTQDGTLTTTSLSARGLTDDQGIVVFDDPMLPALLPVVIVDEQNQPVQGVQAHLLDKGDFLLLSFTDPLGRYQPDWVIVDKADLAAATAWQAGRDHHQAAFPGGVGSARAIAPIIIGIGVIIVSIITGIAIASSIHEIDMEPQQVTRLSSYDQYICKTPERIGAETDLSVSAVTMIIGVIIPMTHLVKLIYDTGSLIASTIAGDVTANSLKAPVLFHEYMVDPASMEIIHEGEGIDPGRYAGSPALFYEEVGVCAEVPDLLNQTRDEAIAALEEKQLKYETTYVDQAGVPLLYLEQNDQDILMVVDQDPDHTELLQGEVSHRTLEVEKLLPIGDYPGMQNTVTLTVQVLPQSSTNGPGNTGDEDPGPDDDLNYLVLDRAYFCNEGPGKYYPVVTAYPAGTRLQLIGTTGEGWWQVAVEYQRLPSCWIGGGTVDGVVAEVPVTARADPEPSTTLGTGDVQVTLFWFTTADLDLAVIDPEGDEINYSFRTSPSGGILDQDANPACHYLTDRPAENIYWPEGEAPTGTYSVLVRYYQRCPGSAATPFLVRVLVDGVVTEYDGTIVNEKDEILIATFERK